MSKERPKGAAHFPQVESDLSRELERIHGYGDDATIELEAASGQDAAAPPRSERSRYTCESELGRGGTGTVYAVRDAALHRHLAMKVLIASQEVDPEQGTSTVDGPQLRRFLEEAQITGQLDHPNIIGLHELGIDAAGRVYFTMPHVRGGDFTEVLELARKQQRGWDLARVVSSLIKVAEALAYAHSKGVVHRDLKPANIMAGRFGEVYVMDWGLAKVLGHDLDTTAPIRTDRPGPESAGALDTQAGSIVGTPAYMAPEQARGDHDRIDGRTDVYSFGALLYHALTGQAPYIPRGSQVSALAALQWAREGPPKPVSEIAPDAPRELVAICEKAMSREPEDRYPDMEEVAAELRRALRGRPVKALPLGRLGRTVQWCRRNPGAVGVLGVVALVGTLGLWQFSNASAELVRRTALDSAAMKTALLEEVNTLYSDEVGARAKGYLDLAHNYAEREGAIPLPATFLTLIGDSISAKDAGFTIRHFSDKPFRFRTDGGPMTPFESEALARLRADKTELVYEFTEEAGKPVLRFAAPRIMKQVCVDCHNTHNDSIKKDWKVGDVRGVLSVTQNLEKNIARSQRVLRGVVLGMSAASAVVLGLLAWFVFRRRRSGAGA